MSNQANTALADQAVLSFTDLGAGGTTATRGPVATTVTIGEPFVSLSKSLTSPVAGLVAGSTVSYSVTVGNAGTTTAFETVVDDALPTGLFFPGGTVVGVVPVNASGNLGCRRSRSGAGGWQTTAFDLPVGDSVTLTFTATLATAVKQGQSLQNVVAAAYTSRDGPDF